MGGPQPLRDVLAAEALLLTPEEAAHVLRVGRTTVYALMKAGELRPVHIGRSCRLSRAELERYVPPPRDDWVRSASLAGRRVNPQARRSPREPSATLTPQTSAEG
jgi:excisionase family DNA binding protein